MKTPLKMFFTKKLTSVLFSVCVFSVLAVGVATQIPNNSDTDNVNKADQLSQNIDNQDTGNLVSETSDANSTGDIVPTQEDVAAAESERIQLENQGIDLSPYYNKGPIDEEIQDSDSKEMLQASPQDSYKLLNKDLSFANKLDADKPILKDTLTWSKLNGAYVEEGQEHDIIIEAADNNLQKLQFQLVFEVADVNRFEKGDIIFSFDAQPWIDRNGQPIGSMSLSVPQAPSSVQTFSYSYDAINNRYLVSNNRVIQSTSTFGMQFTMTKLLPSNIPDMEEINFSVNYQITTGEDVWTGKIGGEDSTITAKMDTKEILYNPSMDSSKTKIYTSFEDAKQAGLTETMVSGINPEEYYFASWNSKVMVSGTKWFSVDAKDSVNQSDKDNYGAIVLGGETEDKCTKHVFGEAAPGYLDSGKSLETTMWTAYKIDKLDLDQEYLIFTNKIEWELTESLDYAGVQDKFNIDTGDFQLKFYIPIDYSVSIDWDSDHELERPSRIYVNLYIDQIKVPFRTVELNGENNWNIVIENLDGGHEYTCKINGVYRYTRFSIIDTGHYYTHFRGLFYDPQFNPLDFNKFVSLKSKNFVDSNLMSDKDKALRQLMDGNKVQTDWTVNMDISAMALTLGDDLPVNDPDSYNKNYYNITQEFMPSTFIDGSDFLIGEYEINGFTFEEPTFYTQVFEPGFDALRDKYSPEEKPDINFVIKLYDGESYWDITAVCAKWDNGSNSYVLITDKDFVEINNYQVTFIADKLPDNFKIYSMSTNITTNVSEISLNTEVYSKILPSERIRSYLEEAMSENNYNMETEICKLDTNLYNKDNEPYMSDSILGNAYLHGRYPKVAPRLLSNSDSVNNNDKSMFEIGFSLDYVAQTNITSTDEFYDYAANGDLPNLYNDYNTWYCYIPYGASVDLNSINNSKEFASFKEKATLFPDLGTTSLVKDVSILRNYKDTYCDLLVVKTQNCINLSGNVVESLGLKGFQDCHKLYFKVFYPYDVFIGNKNQDFKVVAAHEGAGDWVGNVADYIGEPDSAMGPDYNHKDTQSATQGYSEIMSNLNDKDPKLNTFVYSNNKVPLEIFDFSWTTQFQKEVLPFSISNNVYKDISEGVPYIREGAPYKYALNYHHHIEHGGTGVVKIGDMVLVDVIEKLVDDHSPDKCFYGTFDYVDTYQLNQMGAYTKVYASKNATEANKRLYQTDVDGNYIDVNGHTDEDPEFLGDYALVEGAGWFLLTDDITPEDKKQIKSIAVDCTHTEDYATKENRFSISTTEGADIFNSIQSLVYLNMTAPIGDAVADAYDGDGLNPTKNKHAYNVAYLHCLTENNKGTSSQNKNESAFKIEVPPELGIVKTNIDVDLFIDDDNNRDGVRPKTESKTLELVDQYNNVISSKTLEITDNNEYEITFEGVPFFKEGEQIKYDVRIDFGTAYQTLTDVSYDEDYVPAFNVSVKHDPATMDVTGLINWSGDDEHLDARPSKVTLSLLQNGSRIANKTIVVDENNSQEFTFENQYVFYDKGNVCDYTVIESNIEDYKISYSTEAGHLLVNNLYWPYGNIKISQEDYMDSTLAAAGQKMEFTFNVFDEISGSLISGDYNYTIYDKNSSLVSTDKISPGDSFELGGGQYIFIENVPTHTKYQILQNYKEGFELVESKNTENAIYSYLDQEVYFKSKYESEGWFTPLASVQIDNKPIKEKQFAFDLYYNNPSTGNWDYIDAQANKAPDLDAYIAPVQFQSRQYTNFDLGKAESVVYKYKIMQRIDASNKGYVLDDKVYYVNVEVKDLGNGKILPKETIRKDDSESGETVDYIVFKNTYVANGGFSPKAWVEFKDGILVGEDFTFNLIKLKEAENDSEFIQDETFDPQAKLNDVNGTIDFVKSGNKDAITYSYADIDKDFYYLINQTDFSKIADIDYNSSWDSDVRLGINVSVSDNDDGTLFVDYQYIQFIATESEEETIYTTDESEMEPYFINTAKPGNLAISKKAENVPEGTKDLSFDYTIKFTGPNVPENIKYHAEKIEEDDTLNKVNNAPVLESSQPKAYNNVNTENGGYASSKDNDKMSSYQNVDSVANPNEQPIDKGPSLNYLIANGINNLTSLFASPTNTTPNLNEEELEYEYLKATYTVDTHTLLFEGTNEDPETWSGDYTFNVTNSWDPFNNTVKTNCWKIVFDQSCKHAHPKTMREWFKEFRVVKEVEGLQYLNTSMVESLDSTFENFAASQSAHVSIDFSYRDFSSLKSMQGIISSSCEAKDRTNLLELNFSHCTFPILTEFSLIKHSGPNYSFLDGALTGTKIDFSWCRFDGLETFAFYESSYPKYKGFVVDSNVKANFEGVYAPKLKTLNGTFCPPYENSEIYDFTDIILDFSNLTFPSNYFIKVNPKVETIYINESFLSLDKLDTSSHFFTSFNNVKGNNGTTLSDLQAKDPEAYDTIKYFIIDTPDSPGLLSTKAKAVYEDGDLTFYYDEVYHKTENNSVYPVFGTKIDSSWEDLKDKVTSVKFDSSFAEFYPKSTKEWFKDFTALETIDLTNLNTSETSDLTDMFTGCNALKSVTLPKDGFKFSGKGAGVVPIEKQALLPTLPFPPYSGAYSKNDGGLKNKSPKEISNGIDTPEFAEAYSGTWIPDEASNMYRVIFDANGGSGSMEKLLSPIDEALVIPKCTFSFGKFKFSKWIDDSGNVYDEFDEEGKTIIQKNTYTVGQSVTLFAVWDTSGSDPVKDGEIEVNIPAGCRVVLEDLPNNLNYSIFEKPKDQYQLDSILPAGSDVGTISTNTTKESNFTNQYNEDYHSTTVDLSGFVYLDNGPVNESEMFSFSIKEGEEGTPTTVKNATGGLINFGRFEYDTEGEHEYFINQNIPDASSIYSYDEAEYKVVVEVTEAEDGSLLNHVKYFKDDNPTPVESIKFYNTTIPGTLSFTSNVASTSTETESNPDFDYVLSLSRANGTSPLSVKYKSSSSEEATEKTLIAGSLNFSLKKDSYIQFIDLEPGLNYKISFVNVPSGWTIVSTLPVEGTISANSSSEKTVEVKYSANGSCDIIPQVHLDGKVLEAGNFGFELYDSTDSLIENNVFNGAADDQEFSVGPDGKDIPNPYYNAAPIEFAALNFDSAGTYTYKVKQVNPAGSDIYVYDESVCIVTINAEDNNDGTLSCYAIYKYGDDDNKLFFENSIAKNSLKFSSIVKNVTEKASEKVQTYVLSLKDSNDNPLVGTFNYEVCDINFRPSLLKGVLNSTIKSGDTFGLKANQQINITGVPATTQYNIVATDILPGFSVVSYDDDESKTSSSGTIDADSGADGKATINYSSVGSFELPAAIFLQGAFLEKNMFGIKLLGTNNPINETRKNNDIGSFLFNAGDFTNADSDKEFKYTIEQDTSNKLLNIVYDLNKFEVSLTPQDNGDGTLTFDCSYYKDGTALPEGDIPIFKNKFEIYELPFTGALGLIVPIFGLLVFAIIYLLKTKKLSSMV